MYAEVLAHPLMVALAHAMFSSSSVKRSVTGARKKTCRQAMLAEYKKMAFYPEQDQQILQDWFYRDNLDETVAKDERAKVKHYELNTYKKTLRKHHVDNKYEEQKKAIKDKFHSKVQKDTTRHLPNDAHSSKGHRTTLTKPHTTPHSPNHTPSGQTNRSGSGTGARGPGPQRGLLQARTLRAVPKRARTG